MVGVLRERACGTARRRACRPAAGQTPARVLARYRRPRGPGRDSAYFRGRTAERDLRGTVAHALATRVAVAAHPDHGHLPYHRLPVHVPHARRVHAGAAGAAVHDEADRTGGCSAGSQEPVRVGIQRCGALPTSVRSVSSTAPSLRSRPGTTQVSAPRRLSADPRGEPGHTLPRQQAVSPKPAGLPGWSRATSLHCHRPRRGTPPAGRRTGRQ